jgi:RNA polymerase sigma-70 factor (ECF subfamily)
MRVKSTDDMGASGISAPSRHSSGEGPDEGELLKKVARGDRAAFEQLYRLYHRRLARFLTRLTRSPDAAEEIFNDTFWVVWCKAGEFRGDSLPSTWIIGIAYHKARNAMRSSARRLYRMSLETPSPLLTTEGPQRAAELRDWLEHALVQLPDEQRNAIVLCYELGLSCEEIAGIMECPTNTVKTRLFHARAKLQRLLGEPTGDDNIPQRLTRRGSPLRGVT